MKKTTFLLLLAFYGKPLLAQEAPSFSPPQDQNYMTFLPDANAPSRTDWMAGASYLRWNETLRLQKSTLLDTDTANFTGLNLNLERRVVYTNWGWGGEFSFGAGRANGGGNSSSITYTANNQKWTLFSASLKSFYRLTPQVSLGATVPLIMRTITWSSPDGVTEANSGQNFNVGLLFNLALKIDRRIDFYQEIGSLNAQGSTLWRLGLNFKLN